MGIKHLWKLLQPLAEETSVDHWRGKRVAIDANVWVSQFRAVSKKNASRAVISSDTGMTEAELVAVLEGFLRRILKLWSCGITPIFVFDGPTPQAKINEQMRRAAARSQADSDKLSRIALHVLRAQLGPAASADLRLSRLPLAPAAQSSSAVTHLESEDEVDSDDDEIAEARRLATIKESRQLLAKSKSSSSHHFLQQSSSSLLSGTTSGSVMTTATGEDTTDGIVSDFIARETTRALDRRRRDAINRDNLLTHHSLSASASSFMGPRTRTDASPLLSAEASTTTLTTAAPIHPKPVPLLSCGSAKASGKGVKQSSSHPHIYVEEERAAMPLTTARHHHPLRQKSGGDVCPPLEIHSLSSERASSASVSVCEPAINVISSSDDDDAEADEKNARVETDAESDSDDATVYVESRPPMPLPPTQTLPTSLADLGHLLGLLGVSFIVAPAEADEQCAFMCSPAVRRVDAVLTEDSDVIARGAMCVVRGFFSAKAAEVLMYRRCVLEANGLTPDVMKALAMLLGCDYCEGVKGLSAKRATQVIGCLWPGMGMGGEEKGSATTHNNDSSNPPPPHSNNTNTNSNKTANASGIVWRTLMDFLRIHVNASAHGGGGGEGGGEGEGGEGGVVARLTEDKHSLLQHMLTSRYLPVRKIQIPHDFPSEATLTAFFSEHVWDVPPCRAADNDGGVASFGQQQQQLLVPLSSSSSPYSALVTNRKQLYQFLFSRGVSDSVIQSVYHFNQSAANAQQQHHSAHHHSPPVKLVDEFSFIRTVVRQSVR